MTRLRHPAGQELQASELDYFMTTYLPGMEHVDLFEKIYVEWRYSVTSDHGMLVLVWKHGSGCAVPMVQRGQTTKEVFPRVNLACSELRAKLVCELDCKFKGQQAKVSGYRPLLSTMEAAFKGVFGCQRIITGKAGKNTLASQKGRPWYESLTFRQSKIKVGKVLDASADLAAADQQFDRIGYIRCKYALAEARAELRSYNGLARKTIFAEMCGTMADSTDSSVIMNKVMQGGKKVPISAIRAPNGEILTDSADIAGVFRDSLTAISQTLNAGSGGSIVKERTKELLEEISQLRTNGHWSDWQARNQAFQGDWLGVLNSRFTEEQVCKVVRKAALNKAAKGFLSVEQLQIAVDSKEFLRYLTEMFNDAYLNRKSVDWDYFWQSMLFKAGDRLETTNYRALSVGECLRGIWGQLLNSRLVPWFETNGLFHEGQNGSRKTRSCAHNLIILLLAIQHHGKLVTIFMDIRKAYPTAKKWGMLVALASAGVAGHMWWACAKMLLGANCAVKISEFVSDWYVVGEGMLEGPTMHPTLFVTGPMNELGKLLEARGLGLTMAGVYCGMEVSVDDVCLLSADMTGEEPQKMLDVCSQHSVDYDYCWGQGKTVVLAFGVRQLGFVLRMPSMHPMSDKEAGRSDRVRYSPSDHVD